MRKLYLALLIMSISALPVVAIAYGESQQPASEPSKERTPVSGRTILNENTEQTECWLQADSEGNQHKYCTAIIHAAPLWVNDAGTWKNFTDWANVSLTAEGFNFTFGNDWVTIEPVVNYSNTIYAWTSLPAGVRSKMTKERPSKNLLSNWQYGFNLTIPQNYANNLQDFRFKVTSSSVPIVMDASGLIAGGKVLFSFADLEAKGFTWNVTDNTTIIVGNVTGKTVLDLDPTAGYFGKGISDDAYGTAGTPDTNYGTSTALSVYRDSAFHYSGRSYIRYDLNSLYVVSVSDALWAGYYKVLGVGTGPDTAVYFINQTNFNWTETSLTWNNQPCGTSETVPNSTCPRIAVNTTWACNTQGWNTYNVTTAFYNITPQDGYGNVTFVFNEDIEQVCGGTGDPQYRSKEYATASLRPYLNITYTQDLPPNSTAFSQNATQLFSNQTLQMTAQLNDDIGLDYAWLETNESGTWTNYTTTTGRYVKFAASTTATTAYLNWTNISFSGKLYWRIGYNDTGGYSWGSNETELLPEYKLFDYGNNATYWQAYNFQSANGDKPAPDYANATSGAEYFGRNTLLFITPYSQIAIPDSTRASQVGSTVGGTWYAMQRFDMNLSANGSYSRAYNASAMAGLSVTHEGYGGGATLGMNRYMYNFSSSSFYDLGLSKATADVNYTNATSYPYDFVNASGNFYYLQESNYAYASGGGIIYTNWIQVNVTYDRWYGSVANVTLGTVSAIPNVTIISPINSTYAGNNVALGSIYFNVSTIGNAADSCVMTLTDWATNYSMTQANTSFYWLLNTTMNETSYTARFACTKDTAVNQSEAVNFSVDFPPISLADYDNLTGGAIQWNGGVEMAMRMADYSFINWTVYLNTNISGVMEGLGSEGGTSALPEWMNFTQFDTSSYPGKTICWNMTMKDQTANYTTPWNTTANHCFQINGNVTFMLDVLKKDSTAGTSAGAQSSTYIEYNTTIQTQPYTNASAVAASGYYENATVYVFNFTNIGNVNSIWTIQLNGSTQSATPAFCSKNSSWSQGTYSLSAAPWTANASVPPGASDTAWCWMNFTAASTADAKAYRVFANATEA